MLKGRVIGINLEKGFIAVEVDTGITVVELLGGYEVANGDVISGNLDSLGGETLRNESRAEEMDVFIQGIQCTKANASGLMI